MCNTESQLIYKQRQLSLIVSFPALSKLTLPLPQKLENEATIEATSRNPTEVESTEEAEIPGA
jgi:hypothetical protein